MSEAAMCCKSEYITLRDGVALAVSAWIGNDFVITKDKRPAIVITTRYWRATALRGDKAELQVYYPKASYYFSQGYILVVADARGTGASFGCREGEISPVEVSDLGEIIDWTAQQDWCNGVVATTGTSYSACTAIYSLVTAPSALKAVVCHAPDFDVHRHLLAPGGIVNRWMIKSWGETTAALDNNDAAALLANESGIFQNVDDKLLGVRPVDKESGCGSPYEGAHVISAKGSFLKKVSLLAGAIEEHKANFNLYRDIESFVFIDKPWIGKHKYLFDTVYQRKIEQSNTPIVIRCGWHDAGTQLGALSMFVSLNVPLRVILGPWNHDGSFRVDPFHQGDGTHPEAIPKEQIARLTTASIDSILKESSRKSDVDCLESAGDSDFFSVVEYYTLGENCWKTTPQWPLPETRVRRLYLTEGHRLDFSAPTSDKGFDDYRVDPEAGTGLNNRWHTQMGNPVFFPDRQDEDKKLLVYDMPPLDKAVEITGHPVVCLYLRSSVTDGHFFAYLETVDTDGRVRLLTEGQLRGLHRKVSSDKPPYRMFGPYHSFKEKDAQPLVVGEVAKITFDLFPISVVLEKGQRIRIAIAGADRDVFDSIPGCESAELSIERNSIYSSYIDLPFIDNR